jgi:hypothetical protein
MVGTSDSTVGERKQVFCQLSLICLIPEECTNPGQAAVGCDGHGSTQHR